MNKIILLLSLGLICLMGIASVSAVDAVDCAIDECAVNESAVDAVDCAIDESAADVDKCAIDECTVNDSAVSVPDVDESAVSIPNVDESAVDVDESAVSVSDVDAYEYAEDNAPHEKYTSIVNHNCNLEDGLEFQILASDFEMKKKADGKKLDVRLIGKLDAENTPTFESLIQDLDNVEELTLNFKDVKTISTAALRVLNSMQNVMNQNGGSMKLINVPEDIMFIFDLTGFTNILTIEQ